MLELKKQDLSIILEMFDTSKIRQVSISEIRVSGLNDAIYKQVDPDDPSIGDLAASICEHGLLEPLVISEDYFILSGHRRFAAIQMTDMEEIPCEVRQGVHLGDPDFLRLLREYNRQRVKGVDEIIRDQAVDASESDKQAIAKIISFCSFACAISLRSGLGYWTTMAFFEARMPRSVPVSRES